MRLFTIPASSPFLPTLIGALVDGGLIEGFSARAAPERLADVTLCLPTRRACRLARDTFLDVLGGEAVLLPRIVALGSIDEDELDFAQAASDLGAPLDIPPALDGLERRLTLARLVCAWAAQLRPDDPAAAPLVASGPASILALADDLARLMDDMVARDVAWDDFDNLVPDDLDRYWQLTWQFLSIARGTWPAHLAESGRVEPMARQTLLIAAEAARLAAAPKGPVIAAGSTGSMPATARFLEAVARLPQGAVVLPGLDTALDEDAWRLIGGSAETEPVPSHPQFALHGLLERFGVARGAVATLIGGAPDTGRSVLASEAMRPSAATGDWQTHLAAPAVVDAIARSLDGLAVIPAPNPEGEALAIALALRESFEAGGDTALATPDRALARRVMVALDRWGLPYDDSAGASLMETPPGVFARLLSECIADGLAPASLLALLKHPLCRIGGANGARIVATLELALLRGPRPSPGTRGLQHDLALFRTELTRLAAGEDTTLHRAEPRARLRDDQLGEVAALLSALAAALRPLETAAHGKPHDLAELAGWHREVLVALTTDDEGPAIFAGSDGEALLDAFEDLLALGNTGLTSTLRDYPELFQAMLGDRVVRRAPREDLRIHIYGLLEARLTHHDRVILGGLIETTWPPAPRTDPWLSRPMRHQLGLDLPERRIGLTAHDFAQLIGAREAILTYAARAGGAPTVASRFLHRLQAVVGDDAWKELKQRGQKYLDWADHLDRPAGLPKPVEQPAPAPPVASRPRRLSVTQIEDWLRDPYTIYARHILKLAPLDPVDMPPSAADRGSAIHGSLGAFAQKYPDKLPPDALAQLEAIGEAHFAPLMEHPEARVLWWPRFQRIARWYVGWERARRENVKDIAAEIRGTLRIETPRGEFELNARADRIERRSDGTFAIVDFKTGSPPSGKQVRLGLSPQLSLEAAILRDGGFVESAKGGSVSELTYVRLSGGRVAGEEKVLKLQAPPEPELFPDEVADLARAELIKLVLAFENEQQGYPSLVLPMWSNRYGDYDDLARIKEWAATAGAEEPGS